jgi:aryl-alcohol dehydrogenase-like predicted oxidoreductase
MDYRFLGRTGVRVSSLAFGTMLFGKEVDEAEAAEHYALCRDRGINLFDCADVYAGGRSEEVLGRLIRGHRPDVLITSKAFFPTGAGPNDLGASRLHLLRAVEASLERLGTDRIDVYFVHRFDGGTPLEESLRALDDLVRQGKILYLGASNFAAWQVEKALGLSALNGWASFRVLQPMYNLVKRQAEVEIFPMAEAEGLGVMPYSPLGGGLLSGKYASGPIPPASRFAENTMYAVRYGEEEIRRTAERFVAFARDRGFEPTGLAIAWAASHPAVTAPIFGARTMDQLRAALSAAEIAMTPELRAEISVLSPEPPSATDRNEERTPVHFFMR